MNQWFRSWHGAPTDQKWRVIAKKADVPTSLVVSFIWALMDRASQSDDRGSFDGIDLEVIADFLDCDETQLKRIVTQCNERNVTSNNRFVAWEKRQPKREDATASDRVRAFRERQKNQSVSDGETQCNAVKRTETQIREDKIREEDISFSAPARSKKGTRLSEDWQPNPDLIATATSLGLSASQFDRELAKFRDYWASKPGSQGVKLDWDATARNWMRSAAERINPPQRNAPSQVQTPATGVWIKRGTPQWQAWTKHKGKEPFFTAHGGNEGAFFRSEWPPAEGVAA